MFKEAIKISRDYIKPVVNGYKTPYSDEVISGINTVMVINQDGWVLTCRHIAENIILADKIMNKYIEIKEELIANKVPPKKIFKKYELNDESPLIFRNVFLNLIDSWNGMQIYMHDYLDLALIKFEEPGKIFCEKFPIFAKENAEAGEYLCRLGFPYPEINCFSYNHAIKDIVINKDFDSNFQPFPLDGMLTRILIDDKKKISLFEMTNAALLGQNGGPIFNKDGYVVGLQVGNASKDIGLDINAKLKRNLKEIEVKQYSFMNFGIGINVAAIKEFLDKYNVKYKEEK